MTRLSRRARGFGAAAAALAAVALGATAAQAAEGTLRLGPAPEPGKRPAIVNGNPISITQTPWQVYLQARNAGGTYACGGSILDARTVVTAGHCVFDSRTGLQFAAGDLLVVAGISNVRTPEATEQPVRVSTVRVHPLYSYTLENRGVAPDDVAVLELSTPLDLSGPAARAIGLTAAGVNPAIGTAASISGFGLQQFGEAPDGQLYEVGTTIGDPLLCGGEANAVVLCVTSQVGSACEGDSGGPLTIGGALLAGVASFVTTSGPTGPCGVNSYNGYANLAAPEISEFVLGNPTPPVAPRGGRDISARGVFQAGSAMTCTAGTWSGAPSFLYTFVDTRNGQILQSSINPSYTFTGADVGRTVACQVDARNAGGTAISRTESSPAIAADPTPPPAPRPNPTPSPAPRPAPTPRPTPRPSPRRPAARASLRLSVSSSSSRVRAGGTVTYRIAVANRGRAAARGVVVCSAPGRGLSFASLPSGARKSRGRACWTIGTVRAGSSRALRVTLRVARSADPGVVRNAVSLRSGNAGARATTRGVRVVAAQQRGPTRPPAVTG